MPTFNQVIGTSWYHDEVVNRSQFGKNLYSRTRRRGAEQPGLLIAFLNPVLVRTLHRRSVFVKVSFKLTPKLKNLLFAPFDTEIQKSFADLANFEFEAVLPMQVIPVAIDSSVDNVDLDVDIAMRDGKDVPGLIGGYERRSARVRLVVGWDDLPIPPDMSADPSPTAKAQGVLLQLDDSGDAGKWSGILERVHRVTVVLRGDYILDAQGSGLNVENGRALDGNNIPPYRIGDVAVSGNGTAGGDWISMIHIDPP